MSVYDQPELYAAAFSHRDFAGEVSFLLDAAALYRNAPVKRVLELGAGHAPHAGLIAARGISYVGLELHPAMLAHGNERWEGNPAITLLQGNMNDFALTEPADMAVVMLGSLYYRGTDELRAHLSAVANALTDGGLYFLDSCVQFADPLAAGAESEVVHQCTSGEVRSLFRLTLIDPPTQLYREEWNISLKRDDGTVLTAASIEENQALYPQEFRLIIEQQEAFEIAGMYGSWSLDNPIRPGSVITRPVIILRKRQMKTGPSA